eukprot:267157_1
MGTGCSLGEVVANSLCPGEYASHPYARRAVTLNIESELREEHQVSDSETNDECAIDIQQCELILKPLTTSCYVDRNHTLRIMFKKPGYYVDDKRSNITQHGQQLQIHIGCSVNINQTNEIQLKIPKGITVIKCKLI